MKGLKTILLHTFSAYLLVLMVLPCSDVHAVQQSNIAMSYTHTDNGKDDHGKMEICTPFCICSGCVVAVMLQPHIEFVPFNPEIIIKKTPNFYTSLKSDFHSSIWQPPQLV